jgi:hypothetical protein
MTHESRNGGERVVDASWCRFLIRLVRLVYQSTTTSEEARHGPYSVTRQRGAGPSKIFENHFWIKELGCSARVSGNRPNGVRQESLTYLRKSKTKAVGDQGLSGAAQGPVFISLGRGFVRAGLVFGSPGSSLSRDCGTLSRQATTPCKPPYRFIDVGSVVGLLIRAILPGSFACPCHRSWTYHVLASFTVPKNL